MEFVETEYGVPGGLLRPGDSIEKLTRPVEARFLLDWGAAEVRAGDRALELHRQLVRRLSQANTRDEWKVIASIDDLVRAWCGEIPGGR
jgi:hypothetical protein